MRKFKVGDVVWVHCIGGNNIVEHEKPARLLAIIASEDRYMRVLNASRAWVNAADWVLWREDDVTLVDPDKTPELWAEYCAWRLVNG